MSPTEQELTTFTYRVVYERLGWLKPKYKYFAREGDALAYVDKLNSGDKPDLDPLIDIRIDRRPVGRWVAHVEDAL